MNKLTKKNITWATIIILATLVTIAAIYIPVVFQLVAVIGFLTVLWLSLYFAKTMGDKL